MFKKKLEGKVAIITGGASGIGEATARVFSEHGARAIIIADIQDELGQTLVSSISSLQCTFIHCDVTDEDQVKSLVEWTVQNYGQLDIMFSNAGIVNRMDQTVLDLEFSAFDRLMAVNVRGMAACVKHAARAMMERSVKGSIVCTASVAGSRGMTQRTDYCMSKHAVVGLVRSASIQLGEYGIRVNCVSPHGVATPMMCKVLEMEAEEVEKVYAARTRLNGTLTARHVADAVLFLACDESAFVTGHDLLVDGGFSA